MVYTPTFKTRRGALKAFTFVARVLGVLSVSGGMFFLLSAYVASTSRMLFLGVATILIATGLAFILARGPTEAD